MRHHTITHKPAAGMSLETRQWMEQMEGDAAVVPVQTASESSSTCDDKVDWNSMPKDPSVGMAAVFTPYNIVFGGGERYLLAIVASMQVGATASACLVVANAQWWQRVPV